MKDHNLYKSIEVFQEEGKYYLNDLLSFGPQRAASKT
jgi:hypothetical protein